MFFTFKLEDEAGPLDSDAELLNTGSRRPLVPRACQPCRERKVRCTGSLPCRACQLHRRATQCRYGDPKERTNSKRPIRRTSQRSSRLQNDVLQVMFPGFKEEQLSGLTRKQLISMASKHDPSNIPDRSLTTASEYHEQQSRETSPAAADLAALQVIPEQGTITPALKIKPRTDIQDNFNALMQSLKQPSSYLGISSVIAVLRVIDRLHPEVHGILLRQKEQARNQKFDLPSQWTSIDTFPIHHPSSGKCATSPAWDEIPFINSYFTNVHPFIPLIEEHNFRHTYLQSQRTDQRWMLLLSVVLAMGKLAAGPTQVAEHKSYYARIRQYLSIDTLDMAHPETIQALAILGGFYLHYLQLPNLAHSLMGATLRLATALCLHREYPDSIIASKSEERMKFFESRRRIWWCLYILEAWSGTSLGRPCGGRSGSAVTTRYPQEPTAISKDVLRLLCDNIQFCKVSTRMEEALAVSPLIAEEERMALDSTFEECYRVSTVQETNIDSKQAVSPGVLAARNVTRWRYKWARILLHRPVLLWHAISKTPFGDMSEDKTSSIRLCRDITRDLIDDISSTWNGKTPNIMAAWGATWHLYQATMVPLLTLFSDSADKVVIDDSVAQVELAKATLSILQDYIISAGPSLDTISLLFEVSKRRSAKNGPIGTQIEHITSNIQEYGLPEQSPSTASYWEDQNSSQYISYLAEQGMVLEEVFDTLDWNQYPGYGGDYNFRIGLDWDS